MQSRQSNFRFLSLTLLLVFATVLFATACEPGGFPVIENQRSQEVTIYVIDVQKDGTFGEPRNYGVVPAQGTRKLGGIVLASHEWVYRVQEVDPLGNIVFSHDYNMDDLEKISWKITIPP